MRPIFVMLVMWLGANACCDREGRRIQPHWLRVPDPYSLSLETAQRVQSGMTVEKILFAPIRDQRGNCLERAEMSICISNVNYGFWLDLTNKSGKPMRILWPAARYVDELGNGHELFRQPMNPLPSPEAMKPSAPVTVSPGGHINDIIAPIYKSYMVAFGCREYTSYREPLVPTRLDDKNEQQMKTYVDDLAKRQVPVKLMLPIEIDGQRYDYTFTFVLKPRWAGLPKGGE